MKEETPLTIVEQAELVLYKAQVTPDSETYRFNIEGEYVIFQEQQKVGKTLVQTGNPGIESVDMTSIRPGIPRADRRSRTPISEAKKQRQALRPRNSYSLSQRIQLWFKQQLPFAKKTSS